MSDLDVEPLNRALRLMEHFFQTLLTGSWMENLCVLLTALGTRGTAVPQHPRPQELLTVHMETGLYVSAGPEDEFEPDLGVGPGTTGLELRRSPWTMAPWRSGTG